MPDEASLENLVQTYHEQTERLIKDKDGLFAESVLACLISRDRIARLLNQNEPLTVKTAALIAQGDDYLREELSMIRQLKEFEHWRETFNPADNAWWWALPPKTERRSDILLNFGSLILLIGAAGLIADIAPRFLAGGTDVFGTVIVVFQSVVTLLMTRSILTEAGQDTLRRALRWQGIPEARWALYSLVFSAVALLLLVGFRSLLPRIGIQYNNSGFADYQKDLLGTAKFKYERALALDPNLTQAHYNLGLLYEDLNELDMARAEYQIALQSQGDVADLAYNNLGRLYILEGKYETAIPFLLRGEALLQARQGLRDRGEEGSLDPSEEEATNWVFYTLYKNIGWARMAQGRLPEAEFYLKQAIERLPNEAPANCLLAQVLQHQKRPIQEIEAAWLACLDKAQPSEPDEDHWIGLAEEFFNDQQKGE